MSALDEARAALEAHLETGDGIAALEAFEAAVRANERGATQAAKARRPLTLATPCAVCQHPYNWHKAGVCQADPCGCIAFAVDAPAAEVQP